MAVDREGMVLKAPGTSQKAKVGGEEILYSYAKFTQKGVTLAGGFGILQAGTALGRVTATKKYVPYTAAAAHGAGSDVCRGFLRQAVDTTDGDVLGNIVISGMLVNSKLSGVDADAITDLNGRADTVRDFFSF